MYKILEIGGKEYKLEYSVEASLYKDCTATATELMTKVLNTVGNEDIKKVFESFADIPSMVLTLLYAGLMEHHGECGDGTVTSIADTKKLVKLYFAEHKEDGSGNFFELMNICTEQMAEDNFFAQSGIAQFMEELTKESAMPEEAKKVTKKKVTKITE